MRQRLFSGAVLACANFLATGVLMANGTEGSPGIDATAVMRVVGGLLVVLLLVVVLGWAMRRFGNYGSSTSGQLRVLGGVSVGTRERVVLLQVGEQQLLVGVAPGRVQTLHILDKPLAGASGDHGRHSAAGQQGSPFAQRLRQVMRPDEKRQQ